VLSRLISFYPTVLHQPSKPIKVSTPYPFPARIRNRVVKVKSVISSHYYPLTSSGTSGKFRDSITINETRDLQNGAIVCVLLSTNSMNSSPSHVSLLITSRNNRRLRPNPNIQYMAPEVEETPQKPQIPEWVFLR